MMKQIIAKACKIVGRAFICRFQTWSGQADKNFQGRTKFFNTIAEKNFILG